MKSESLTFLLLLPHILERSHARARVLTSRQLIENFANAYDRVNVRLVPGKVTKRGLLQNCIFPIKQLTQKKNGRITE